MSGKNCARARTPVTWGVSALEAEGADVVTPGLAGEAAAASGFGAGGDKERDEGWELGSLYVHQTEAPAFRRISLSRKDETIGPYGGIQRSELSFMAGESRWQYQRLGFRHDRERAVAAKQPAALDAAVGKDRLVEGFAGKLDEMTRRRRVRNSAEPAADLSRLV